MKLSTSTIILAAALFSGENGFVQAKNAKEFQERRRKLSKKQTNRLSQDNTPSLLTKNTPLDGEELIMPAMQKESRQDYIYMMGEGDNMDMNAFEEFGGEVPIMYEIDEEEMDMVAMDGDGDEDASFDQGGLYYTQEDIDRMVDTMDMEEMDHFYEEEEESGETFFDEIDMGMAATAMDEDASFDQGGLYYTQEDLDKVVDATALKELDESDIDEIQMQLEMEMQLEMDMGMGMEDEEPSGSIP